MSGTKKRVRFKEAPDVREFEAPEHKKKREMDPMEALEGGINAVCIYEGGASMDPASAAAERARQRKDNLMARFEEGMSFLGNIEAVEAAYEEPEERFNDAGMPIEPFHLKREREEGYFDEGGTYVEYKGDDVEDSWADSLADVEVDESWLARVRAAQAGHAGNDEPADDLDAEELRAYKQRLADLLHPGETTLQALRRLGRSRVERTVPAAGGAGRGGSDSDGERAAHQKPQQVMPSPVREAFDRLTEFSSLLMEHGEYGIHSQTREAILRSLLEESQGAGAEVAGAAHTQRSPATAPPAQRPQPPEGGPAGSGTVLAVIGGGDAAALLAQQLLAGAEGGGGEDGVRRMSSDQEMPAAAAVRAVPAEQQGEEEELDMFADENEAPAAAAVVAAAPAAPAAGGGRPIEPPGTAAEGAVREAGEGAIGGPDVGAHVAAAGSAGVGGSGGRDAGASADVDVPEHAAPGEQSRGDRAPLSSLPAAPSSAAQAPSGLAAVHHGAAPPPEQPGGEAQQLEGFEFDSASGFWYNTSLGCYYDPAQQLYGDATSGHWFKYLDGQYEPVS